MNRWRWLAVGLGLALPGCGGDAAGPGSAVQPTIEPAAAAVTVGGQRRFSIAATDGSCDVASGRVVGWRSSDPALASVTSDGLATGVAVGEPVAIMGECAGRSDTAALAVTRFAATATMLNQLSGAIAGFIEETRRDLPRNPRSQDYMNAKLALLQRPNLAAEIVRGHQYLETSVAARAGALPVVAVFALDTMRPRAEAAVAALLPAPALLEDFFDARLPASALLVWYGFKIGNTGGGGTIWTEDQGTYEARMASYPDRLPFVAILHHELAHSFVGNEALTQFLELYVYNVARTGSPDVGAWTATRGYPGSQESNTGVFAVLDIYALIGRDATARAYRVLYTLAPPYGQPLSPEAQRAFVDQAPAPLRAQVAAKAAAIGIS